MGYCQGTNFIAATLLVQMPEERAFAVFVCLMYRFGLRSIYISNFEGLTRILFFIDELLRDGSSKLRKHLVANDIGHTGSTLQHSYSIKVNILTWLQYTKKWVISYWQQGRTICPGSHYKPITDRIYEMSNIDSLEISSGQIAPSYTFTFIRWRINQSATVENETIMNEC